MPATYEPIATTTLGSAASTITLSSIPATYTDLRLVFVHQGNTANPFPILRFNSDSGTNYSYTDLYGSGSTAGTQRVTNSTRIAISDWGTSSTTIPALSIIDIFSYAGSTNKTCLINHNADLNGSGYVERRVGLWRNTSAINALEISSTQNFKAGTTATLYGILKA